YFFLCKVFGGFFCCQTKKIFLKGSSFKNPPPIAGGFFFLLFFDSPASRCGTAIGTHIAGAVAQGNVATLAAGRSIGAGAHVFFLHIRTHCCGFKSRGWFSYRLSGGHSDLR